jgi:hypothetical protein
MEFVDNTGHIFSLPSYKEEPIGYEYEEYSYIFWIDSNNTSKLSINNFYSKPIYALYELNKNFTNESLENDNSPVLNIDIYIKDSNVFKLISSKELQSAISSNSSLTDYINLNMFDDENEIYNFIKTELTNEDLCCIKTEEIKYTNDTDVNGTVLNYLMIPIYPIACATEPGTWITNIMIHIHNNSNDTDEWCYISVGGEFVEQYEELVINGKNMGISLPKDIIKAVYQESLYNNEFNEALYNQKLKEYLFNYMGIRGEIGNFKSAIDSLKWFGYGDKITISKLLRTDNQFKEQYILDYFDISYDILESFKSFISKSFVSLMIMINKELDEQYLFDISKTLYNGFLGENKPKMLSLIDNYEKVKIGNHDMPIEDDKEKYWYWKPYFDFSFNELGIKLMCLSHYYKKYFLPIHLNIHNVSLGYKVFANDIKFTNHIGYAITYPSIILNDKNEVCFKGNGVHYFTKQIHLVDDNFNEFTEFTNEDYLTNIDESYTIYKINDTCVNIPIEFKITPGYYNCVLLLQKANNNDIIFESHFSFCQNNNNAYKNFIIYPKIFNNSVSAKYNDNNNLIDVQRNTKLIEYWVNNNFVIKLLVNNKWYEYDFKLKIHNPQIDFGVLKYRYYFNDHNYLFSKIMNNNISSIHNIVLCDSSNINDLTINIDDYNIFDTGEILNNVDIYDNYTCIKFSKFNDTNVCINWDNEDILAENEYIYIYEKYANTPTINMKNMYTYNEKISYMYIDELSDNESILIFYPERFNKPLCVKCDLKSINSLIYDKYNLSGDNSYIETFDINYQEHVFQYFKENYNLLSPFKQIKYLDNQKHNVVFNAYMHNKQLTDMNDINFDVNIYDIIHYHLNQNLMYIDESLLNNNFYQYIIYTDENDKSYEIYIYKDLIGKTINFIPEELSDNRKMLLCTDNAHKYILSDENNNGLLIESNNENIITLNYNSETNEYEDEFGGHYIIYDKLHKNIDEIFNKYTSLVNLPNNMKYKNSIHMFGIYVCDTTEYNVLVFHNNINLHINGLQFIHGTTYDKNNNEQLKIFINGNLNNNETIDSRYPNTYGLYWADAYNEDNNIIPKEELNTEYNNYGLYVKRDYDQLYNNDNSNNINIWDLENITEYSTEEFTYFKENKDMYIGSIIYNSLDDFYQNNIFESQLLDEYKDIQIYIKDNIYHFDDLTIVDLSDFTKRYTNDLHYTVHFLNNDGEEITVSLNDINNKSYSKLMVKFYYNKVHIVRNRFYLLSDYIKLMNIDLSNINIREENGKTILRTIINGETVDNIELIKYDKMYQYTNRKYNHLISNQNPSTYWYNYDKHKFENLPLYLNEIERIVYNENDTIENFKNKMNTYFAKWEESKRYADDEEEARYSYINYLVKDFTGNSGIYKIDVITNFDNNDDLRLCVETINEIDGNIVINTYSNNGEIFELTGNEKQVKAYIQIKNYNFNFENNKYYFIPKLLKIIENETRLPYIASESGNDIIPVKLFDKNFEYGDNNNQFVYDLYNDFFKLKFNVYDTYIEYNKIKTNLLSSVYSNIEEINLETYLNYDFYLMHDDKYWYGLYISQETCDKIRNKNDLKILDINKKISFINSKNIKYVLNYERSSEEYLLNRYEYNSSHGKNQFNNDDIICGFIYNNDRLPFNSSISSKWNIHPMSLGMSTDVSFDSNAELTIISLPHNDNKYENGYYQINVRYSLDRDIQHQFKNTSVIRVS